MRARLPPSSRLNGYNSAPRVNRAHQVLDHLFPGRVIATSELQHPLGESRNGSLRHVLIVPKRTDQLNRGRLGSPDWSDKAS